MFVCLFCFSMIFTSRHILQRLIFSRLGIESCIWSDAFDPIWFTYLASESWNNAQFYVWLPLVIRLIELITREKSHVRTVFFCCWQTVWVDVCCGQKLTLIFHFYCQSASKMERPEVVIIILTACTYCVNSRTLWPLHCCVTLAYRWPSISFSHFSWVVAGFWSVNKQTEQFLPWVPT